MIDEKEIDLLDVMNPPGMFILGERQREHSTKDILPSSGKLIPEFDGRRSIRDMFTRKPFPSQSQTSEASDVEKSVDEPLTMSKMSNLAEESFRTQSRPPTNSSSINTGTVNIKSPGSSKRSIGESPTNRTLKRAKSGSTPSTPSISQQSLKGFFKPKVAFEGAQSIDVQTDPLQPRSEKGSLDQINHSLVEITEEGLTPETHLHRTPTTSPLNGNSDPHIGQFGSAKSQSPSTSPKGAPRRATQDQEDVHDPIETKESWSKLFAKPAAPRCEGHNEPCISLLTKKSGMNCGRSFWMCPRPLGPSGAKEKNTQWRCQTFIWCSDWNSIATRDAV